jgi:hypothetical protein
MAVAVLSVIAGTLLSYTTAKQAAPFQATSWQEAGTAAEAGVELALSALRRSIHDGSSAWGGWDTTTAVKYKYLTDDNLLGHAGEGNQNVRAVVEVSVPTGAGTVNPPQGGNPMSSWKQAYVIRSTGIANVPGPARLPLSKPDQALRKLNFLADFRTQKAVANGLPQVARVIEAVASPVTPFPLAIHAKEQLDIIKGQGMIVDSYEPSGTSSISVSKDGSSYSNFVPTWQSNGTIATNGKRKDIIRLENVVVKGSAAKGGGNVHVKAANASITGEIIDGFYRELKPIPYPGTRQNPAFVPQTTASSPAAPPLNGADRPSKSKSLSNPVVITAGKSKAFSSDNKPQTLYYKLNNIHLHDGEVLKVVRQNSSSTYPDGADAGIAEIWVTGDIVLHKGGRIEVDRGTRAIFYCEKNVTIEEKDANKPGLLNHALKRGGPTGLLLVPDPEALQFYGVSSPSAKAKKRKFKLKSNMVGLAYAPEHEFEINMKKSKSGETQRAVWGSLAGRKFKINGATQVHYDESLGEAGKPFDYTLESWQEDWFDPSVRPAN